MSNCKIGVGSSVISVPGDSIVNSKLFADFVNCYGHNTIIPFPEQFTDVADIYISHLKDKFVNVKKLKTLKRCFELCHLIEDNNFLQHVVNRLFDTQLVPLPLKVKMALIQQLDTDLQQDIYMCFTLALIPDNIVNTVNFLNDWIQVNNGKYITIDGQTYMSVSYDHSGGRTIKTKRNLNDKLVLDGPTIFLIYVNNTYRLYLRQEYKCGTLHGKITKWSLSHQYNDIKYINTSHLDFEIEHYKDERRSTEHGIEYKYYGPNNMMCEIHWMHGVKHGVEREWYPSTTADINGQLRISSPYNNGKRCGTYYRYYETGQIQHEYTFVYGLEIGKFCHWSIQGQLEYNVIIDDTNRHKLTNLYKDEYNEDNEYVNLHYIYQE